LQPTSEHLRTPGSPALEPVDDAAVDPALDPGHDNVAAPPGDPEAPGGVGGPAALNGGRSRRSAQWTPRQAAELYNVGGWGAGFFEITDEGTVACTPDGPRGPRVDLKLLAEDLERRGLAMPILVRFGQILRNRVESINHAFRAAIDEYDYEGMYRLVMPIKVNQQRHVVEELLVHGRAYHLGLEAGSKPELLIALALMNDPEGLVICNGYKDLDYIETALLTKKLGRKAIIVIDRFDEIEAVIDSARRLGIYPSLGLRVKLHARGAGRWNESSGARSKFGLNAVELCRAVERMREAGFPDAIQLLHFHIGSQITAVRAIKDAMREACRVYAELCKLGAELRYVDVGGGLAVDYDGSRTNFHSSMNYSLQEYANDVVWALQAMCQESGVTPPTIVSESGRALVAHHSVLIVNVLGVARADANLDIETVVIDENSPKILRELNETVAGITRKNYQESFHDLQELRDEALSLFNHGLLCLRDRGRAEELAHVGKIRIQKILQSLDYVPDDLEGLPKTLADTYYANFSLFQSLPDHWAVKHLFPVMPLQRLDERPDRQAVLADLTCDSDGKIDQFIDLRDVKSHLPLHEPRAGESYRLGIFLVGAYQETLGDLHNLFGDTNAVHVEVRPSGYRVKHVVEGDSVTEVLGYVQYDRDHLMATVRSAAEDAYEAGRMTLDDARRLLRHYEDGLNGYTYLVEG
jgi:arginine decarboxylase